MAQLLARAQETGDVGEHWPIAEARLICDLGGEALLSLTYEGGETSRFGNDPYHREFPLRAHGFSIDAEAVARLPFGQPVREPRLTAAHVAWIDLAVDALHRRFQTDDGREGTYDPVTPPTTTVAATRVSCRA